jgi:hypothetical protein
MNTADLSNASSPQRRLFTSNALQNGPFGVATYPIKGRSKQPAAAVLSITRMHERELVEPPRTVRFDEALVCLRRAEQ